MSYMSDVYEKQQELLKKSNRDVQLFADWAIEDGYECFMPSDLQDMVNYWDIGITKNGKIARVQVKGNKLAHKLNYTWVELKSVKKDRLGRNVHGWLYGDAHVLALLRGEDDRFDIYNMSKLRKYIETNVDFSAPILVAKALKDDGEVDYEYMSYRQYNRRGDVTVIIPLNDIKGLMIKTLYK